MLNISRYLYILEYIYIRYKDILNASIFRYIRCIYIRYINILGASILDMRSDVSY